MEENNSLFPLLDENGEERYFELLATANHNDKLYAMLVPALEDDAEEEETEVKPLILKIGSVLDKEQGEVFDAVTPDDPEYDAIFEELQAEYESGFASDEADDEEE